MLDAELVAPDDPQRAAEIFARDGFVALEGALAGDALQTAQEGARRVCAEQMAATPLDAANRGHARYSFGSQIHHPEWAMLVDLPTVLPTVEAAFGHDGFACSGAGGDYSCPGAKIQHLHSDMADMLADPLGQVSVFDLPVPFIVVNFLMTEFRRDNGAIRFVPGTQRTRVRPPKLDQEPRHWQESILCAPAGTAVVRDVRTWHGGTANDSDDLRIMTSAGYYARWFQRPGGPGRELPLELWRTLSERGRALCRNIVDWESALA